MPGTKLLSRCPHDDPRLARLACLKDSVGMPESTKTSKRLNSAVERHCDRVAFQPARTTPSPDSYPWYNGYCSTSRELERRSVSTLAASSREIRAECTILKVAAISPMSQAGR